MKVLIIGGAGMLGHRLWKSCLDTFGPDKVACTLRKTKSHYKNFNLFEQGQVFQEVDVLDFQDLTRTLELFKPDFILNCVGLTLRKPETMNLENYIDINGMLPHRLAKWGMAHNCRVIQFSTDCVFNGSKGNYKEDDIPDAKDLYGRSKFLGEIIYPNALTLRAPFFGRELEGKTELLEWALAQSGKKIQGFSRAIYSGVSTLCVSEEINKILLNNKTLNGVYHISSKPISKFDLLNLINDVFDTKTTITANAEHSSDKSLNCGKYSDITGFIAPQWQEMLLEIKNDNKINYGN